MSAEASDVPDIPRDAADAEDHTDDEDFERLLTLLKTDRGFDFTGYKRTSLRRRITRRMQQLGVVDVGAYVDVLRADPAEFGQLFTTILINVTDFFRDAAAWDALRDHVLPQLLADHAADGPLRLWSAGCASGQEPYSLAMLLSDLLGAPADFADRVKIYATDVDAEALAEARAASYDERQMQSVPEDLRERHFERRGARWVVRKDLRRAVIFGRNDLVQDSPIGRIHLLTCRNTLMYFTASAQEHIVQRLHFALADGGCLMLGKAEMVLSQSQLFAPVDLPARIFAKTGPTVRHRRTRNATPTREGDAMLDRLQRAALRATPQAQLVVAADGMLAFVNAAATALFGVSASDVGRPFSDLEASYRPAEVRQHIDTVLSERRPVTVHEVRWARSTSVAAEYYDVSVTPLLDRDSAVLGVSVAVVDVTDQRGLREELKLANAQLETAYEELQSTNEELETTNEELQSTVEELETTNEELQSTNEELETTNEELQSTNDELQSINDMLRDRTGDLDTLNAFLDGILGGLRGGIVVVDSDLLVQVWNPHSEELWGLRSAEAVGEHLLVLDIGLPLAELRTPVRAVLAGTEVPPLELVAVNRRGRPIRVRVTFAPLAAANGIAEPAGAIIVVDTLDDEPDRGA